MAAAWLIIWNSFLIWTSQFGEHIFGRIGNGHSVRNSNVRIKGLIHLYNCLYIFLYSKYKTFCIARLLLHLWETVDSIKNNEKIPLSFFFFHLSLWLISTCTPVLGDYLNWLFTYIVDWIAQQQFSRMFRSSRLDLSQISSVLQNTNVS